MSSNSLPGHRSLPESKHDLDTYWGRVKHAADISDPRTLFAGKKGLDDAKRVVTGYKSGEVKDLSPDVWKAKKIVDSTIHPDTGEPVLLPFRMSCFVLSNLVVTAGMLSPGLGIPGTIAWQIVNQSLNVAINTSNANKSTTITRSMQLKSFALAAVASSTVVLALRSAAEAIAAPDKIKTISKRLVPFVAVASAGVLNVYIMRAEERRLGIAIFPHKTAEELAKMEEMGESPKNLPTLGKSVLAAKKSVKETAMSRVFSAAPIMVIPPLLMIRLQEKPWFKTGKVKWKTIGANVGLIGLTSILVLPFALAVFPNKQVIAANELEEEFHDKGGESGMVTFNRGW